MFFKCAVEDLFPPNDTPKLRVVPLLLTADLRAHAEIGQTSAGGFKGCRRCHVEGEYIPVHKHYYYGNFQNQFHFPATKRSAETNRQLGKKVDSAQLQLSENGLPSKEEFKICASLILSMTWLLM